MRIIVSALAIASIWLGAVGLRKGEFRLGFRSRAANELLFHGSRSVTRRGILGRIYAAIPLALGFFALYRVWLY